MPDSQALAIDRRPRRASLVVQTSFLGDVVLTTPLIAELANRGPVDVVATPGGASVLANNPEIREIVVYDKRRDLRGMAGLWRTSQRLKATFRSAAPPELADMEPVAYLAQGSVRSAMLALLAGFRVRVGFETSAGRALYTQRVPYRDDQHHVERLWRLAGSAATTDAVPTARQLQPLLFPSDRDIETVNTLLARAGYAGEPLVALAPGSVWATKRWPYYAALATTVERSGAGRVVLIGGPADVAVSGAVAAALPPRRAIDGTGKLSPLASAELIRRARVLVTNDSAPQHFASAVGTPTVTIFGPTVPAFGFGPLAPQHATAGVDALPCRPCDRHGPRRCPLGHWRCMQELTVAHVERLLNEVISPPPAAGSPTRPSTPGP